MSMLTCPVMLKCIYINRCLGCNEYYIGQTGGKLQDRRTVHAQQIRDPSTYSSECTFGHM